MAVVKGWLNIRPRSVYAFEGEKIVCAAGHVNAEVMQPIMIGDMHRPGMFWWPYGEPTIGQDHVLCYDCLCGFEVFRRGRLRFKDGWR